MKTPARFTITFLAAVMLLIPFQASALSVKQYKSETKDQRADFVAGEIAKIVADVAKVNPALSKSIYDYFHAILQGQPESPGLIAFAGALAAVEDAADHGKLDLDKVQIEGILLGIIKRDVMPKQAAKNAAPPSPGHK
jgi:hypothetical protein